MVVVFVHNNSRCGHFAPPVHGKVHGKQSMEECIGALVRSIVLEKENEVDEPDI